MIPCSRSLRCTTWRQIPISWRTSWRRSTLRFCRSWTKGWSSCSPAPATAVETSNKTARGRAGPQPCSESPSLAANAKLGNVMTHQGVHLHKSLLKFLKREFTSCQHWLTLMLFFLSYNESGCKKESQVWMTLGWVNVYRIAMSMNSAFNSDLGSHAHFPP